MRDRDPLGNWLFLSDLDIPASHASEFRTQLQETLDELEAYLAHPPEKINANSKSPAVTASPSLHSISCLKWKT
jgi:hypothetical protein